MEHHDIALKKFANASADAFEAVAASMTQEQRDYIARLFEVGNSIAMCHAVQPDGSSTITFEIIFHDGTRRVLASLSGKRATMQ